MSTNNKPKLSDEEVLRQAKETLAIYLPLEADGYCVTSETLYDILLAIAANRGTTESICAELADAPDPETIRGYFNEQFTIEQLSDLQQGSIPVMPPIGPGSCDGSVRSKSPLIFTTVPTLANEPRRKPCGYAAKPKMGPLGSLASRQLMPSFTDNE